MTDKLPPREFYKSEEQYARAYSSWEDDQRPARRAAEAQRVGRMRRCMSSAKFSDDSQFFSVLTGKEFHQKDFNLEVFIHPFFARLVMNWILVRHGLAAIELPEAFRTEYYQCMRTGVLGPFIGQIIF
ncbi:hypothetical protein GPALN_006871 [Globodera pallida]|nr:hypothetical protein GPALN_006871 [Globodera pallida]